MLITTEAKEIFYSLYVLEWKRNHISNEREQRVREAYATALKEGEEYEDFSDYLSENGYDGELYACKDEFLENEFLDQTYMHSIITRNIYATRLWKLYLQTKKEVLE